MSKTNALHSIEDGTLGEHDIRMRATGQVVQAREPKMRHFIERSYYLAKVLAFFTVFAVVVTGAALAERPNIIWIVAEDMSPDLGCYGNELVTTPQHRQDGKRGCALYQHVCNGTSMFAQPYVAGNWSIPDNGGGVPHAVSRSPQACLARAVSNPS